MAAADPYKISINVIGVKGKFSEEEDVILVKVGTKEKKIAPKPQKKALKFPEQNPEATVVLSLQKKANNEVIGEISFKLNPITFAPAKAVQSSRLKCLFDLKAPGSDTVVGEIRAQITCSLATAEKGKLKHSKQAKSWDIPNSELKFFEQVGEGASATVWHGKYRGQEVAIKVLKDNMPPKERADFEKEFEILTTLRGSTIVLFYGICQPPPSTYLVLEWCPHGSLHTLLTSSEVFTWTRAIGFCRQMTKALATLHHWNPVIVHRDLKSQNLLVSSSGELKVCDFGLSRATNTPTGGQTTLQKLRGTFQFTAPEIYQLQLYTVKADIYSLGVVLWELFNRLLKGRYEQPFSEYTQFQFDFQIIIQVAKNNLRPTIGENWPPVVGGIIKKCWDKSPDVRPDVDQLMDGIKILEEEYAKQKDAWDALIPKV